MYYTNDDLTNWEFKILRADSGEFGNKDYLKALLQQEAEAGWTIVEKYDDQHIRLKRPISARAQDVLLPRSIDPYRTTYSLPLSKQTFTFLFTAGCLFVAVTLIVLLAIIASWPQ